MLSREFDNFIAAPETIVDARRLITGLQEIEWNNSLELQPSELKTDPLNPHTYVPLFVGIEQPGDGLFYDHLLSGTSPIPPEMAIGATWDPEMAKETGALLGSELEAIGFNLYLGPSLDVLTLPSASQQGNLGTLVFGGDPYWVGKLGQAYIAGLHSGSNHRMAVISRNFPGRGEADRPPEEEVSTVRKSLEQLKQIELAPFFSVTGDAPTQEMTTDGLLVSHIRYQGFQGNIRATTRPVSFDSQALGQIMGLEPFSKWRQSGGIIVSDKLGSSAVKLFYDPAGNNFSGLIVARDALLAGNDLLYLGDIKSTGDAENYETIVKILAFFTQKYKEDASFAQRVDEAVLRILTLKFKLYDSFTLESVAPDSGTELPNPDASLATSIARESATLISPMASDLNLVIPNPPAVRDRMVFITDNRTGKQCSTCPIQPYLATDALMAAILKLYGPQGGNQVASSRLSSYTLDDLASILPGSAGNPELEESIRLSDWLVFSTLELDKNEPHQVILNRFLLERPDLLRQKQVVLFSFSAPYYLDATDISKLTAFYGMYGKSQPFVDTAARILFKEFNPVGRLPVSVPGIGYDLIDATAPAADQIILLTLDFLPAATPEAGTTPEPTAIALFTQGNTISVRTGTIIDNNGNPVPDGTVVTFTEKLEGGPYTQQQSQTVNGIATASFRLDNTGLVEISAVSEPAMTSVVLQIDVSPGQASAVTVIAPTPVVTLANTPQPSPTPAEIVTTGDSFTSKGFPLFLSWLLAMVILIMSAGITYLSVSQIRSMQWSLRWTVCLVLGGLAAYNYAAFGLPGSQPWIESSGFSAILIMLLIGMAMGLLAAWAWESGATKQKRTGNSRQ
jgi:beta-N-acetylhexosaminidase